MVITSLKLDACEMLLCQCTAEALDQYGKEAALFVGAYAYIKDHADENGVNERHIVRFVESEPSYNFILRDKNEEIIGLSSWVVVRFRFSDARVAENVVMKCDSVSLYKLMLKYTSMYFCNSGIYELAYHKIGNPAPRLHKSLGYKYLQTTYWKGL